LFSSSSFTFCCLLLLLLLLLVSSLLLCLFNLGPLSKVHADSIGDTSHQGSISRFRQSVASETSSHPLLLNRQSVVTILSLWELNNFHCSCLHGSISVDTLQYYLYLHRLYLQVFFRPATQTRGYYSSTQCSLYAESFVK
jgi:hypothetical protein